MLQRATTIRVFLSLGIVGLLMLTAAPTMAKKIKVNSTADVIANDGICTLREAVIAANTDTASGSYNGECRAGKGADTIVLQSGVYNFTIVGTGEDNAQTGDLDILDDLTVKGTGAKETIIDANYIDRVFHVMGNVKANFKGINVQNGWVTDDDGGGIYNSGTLTITSSTVSSNTASGDYANGGGIYNWYGTMKISNSKVFDNTASGAGGDGGGINNWYGAMKITNSKVFDNRASGYYYADGGGINNWYGTMKITNSKVFDNTARAGFEADGGGIYNNNTLTITNSKVYDNIADGIWSDGGGIWNGGTSSTLTIKGISRISGNTANEGGGIYNSGAFHKSGQTRIKNNSLNDTVGI